MMMVMKGRNTNQKRNQMEKDFSIFVPAGCGTLEQLTFGDTVCVLRNGKVEYWQVRGYGGNVFGKSSLTLTPAGNLSKEKAAREKLAKKRK